LGCTAGELLDRVGSRELSEWHAYETVAGPIGPARIDVLFARLMAQTANINRKKNSKALTAEDFMPRWDPQYERVTRERRPHMSGEDMLRAVKSMHRRMGGNRVDAG
jgi:primosomal protein N''